MGSHCRTDRWSRKNVVEVDATSELEHEPVASLSQSPELIGQSRLAESSFASGDQSDDFILLETIKQVALGLDGLVGRRMGREMVLKSVVAQPGRAEISSELGARRHLAERIEPSRTNSRKPPKFDVRVIL
jgi:hypothetical protein